MQKSTGTKQRRIGDKVVLLDFQFQQRPVKVCYDCKGHVEDNCPEKSSYTTMWVALVAKQGAQWTFVINKYFSVDIENYHNLMNVPAANRPMWVRVSQEFPRDAELSMLIRSAVRDYYRALNMVELEHHAMSKKLRNAGIWGVYAPNLQPLEAKIIQWDFHADVHNWSCAQSLKLRDCVEEINSVQPKPQLSAQQKNEISQIFQSITNKIDGILQKYPNRNLRDISGWDDLHGVVCEIEQYSEAESGDEISMD